jgi:hypothetical protein
MFDPGAGQPPEWQKLALAFRTAIPQHVMWLKSTVYVEGHPAGYFMALVGAVIVLFIYSRVVA